MKKDDVQNQLFALLSHVSGIYFPSLSSAWSAALEQFWYFT